MSRLILSLILFSQVTLACPKPVTYLTKGSTTSCTGYLFSPEQELFVRQKVEDHARLLELVEKQNELINIQDMRLAKQIEINENLRKQNQHLESTTMTEKLLWFGAGVLLTGTGAYLLRR